MIRYGAWQIGFFNRGFNPGRSDVFGCSTCGAITGRQYHLPDNAGLFAWGAPVRGCAFFGDYAEVLKGAANCSYKPTFMLALFTRLSGAAAFLAGLGAAMPDIPIAGGVAAGGINGAGELMPKAGDAALLMCESEEFTASYQNALEARGGIYEFDAASPRELKRLRQPDMPWEDAAMTIQKLKESYRVGKDDFESFAFSDNEGRNLRLMENESGEGLRVCADLPGKGYLHLRISNPKAASEAIINSARARRTLFIGDIGFHALINRPFSTHESSAMAFLDCQIAGGRLCNLTLSAVKASKRKDIYKEKIYKAQTLA
jgi:hypothetical protein